MTATPTAPSTDAAPFRGLRLVDVRLSHADGGETVHALYAVSLDVRRGEFAAIVGPSGSGKSSLLAVSGGLARPDSGTVLVDGHDMAADSARTALRRRHVGYVFQSGNLVPALTAVDQVRLPPRLGRVDDARDPLELLADVGMAEKAHRRPHQLSGGERQRVGIARALVTRPAAGRRADGRPRPGAQRRDRRPARPRGAGERRRRRHGHPRPRRAGSLRHRL